jgi:hypothetical protein
MLPCGSFSSKINSVIIQKLILFIVDYTFCTGNQTNDSAEYQTDLMRLVEDCSSSEKQIIFDVASATKKSLRENKGLQIRDNQS